MKEKNMWNPKSSIADRRLLFGIKVLFWTLIFVTWAAAVKKWTWC